MKSFNIILDKEDQWLLDAYKWYPLNSCGNTYARAYLPGIKPDTRVLLHHMIMGKPLNDDIDHENHNGLDCRRKNLKICSHRDNCNNKRKSNRTGWPGVYVNGSGYAARGRINKKVTHIGQFETPEKAYIAYLMATEGNY